jgi:hypothetical protein
MYVHFATRSKQISSFGLQVKLSKLHDKETRTAFEDSGFLGCDAVQEVFFSDCLILKMKVPLMFKMSGTAHLMTLCHIPEGLNLQQQNCENLRSSRIALNQSFLYVCICVCVCACARACVHTGI